MAITAKEGKDGEREGERGSGNCTLRGRKPEVTWVSEGPSPQTRSLQKSRPGRDQEQELKLISEEPCFPFSLCGRGGYDFRVGAGMQFRFSQSEPFDVLP